MGKTKNKKFKASKPQPTGLPSLKDLDGQLENGQESLSAEPSGSVAEVLQKLQSANEEERECGCSLMASLIGQPSALPLLLQHNTLRIIMPLILDTSRHVQHRALGALRNLSVEGGHKVCEEMVRKDVMTPLSALFQQFGVTWIPEAKDVTSGKVTDTRVGIFTEAVHLLWNLCESCNVAVTVFNKENLIQYLLPLLREEAIGVYGVQAVAAVAQCLQAVTENNLEAAAACRHDSCLQQLMQLVGDRSSIPWHLLLRALAAAILANVSDGSLGSAAENLVSSIVAATADILSVDVTALLRESVQSVVQNGFGSKADASGDHLEVDDVVSQTVDNISNVLTAQQVALAVVGNLCVDDEDEWDDLNSSESSSSDDCLADVEMEADDKSQSFMPFCVPAEVHSSLQQFGIVGKVLAKAMLINVDNLPLVQKLRGGKKLLSSLQHMQTDALLCLNNIVSAMDASALGGLLELHTVWESLSQFSMLPQASADPDLLEGVTCAMRAVIEKLAILQSPKFAEVTLADLQYLFHLGRDSSHSQVRTNAIRIISTIGCLLAKSSGPHPLLKEIGTFLLLCVGHDVDLWVTAEALDSIFDVFSEDHLDPLTLEIQLIEKLQQFLPLLKAKMNSQKKSLGEHYPVISTAKTNLIRFIKYKTRK